MQVLHNKLGTQKNMKLLVDNQYNVATDDAGVFVIALRNETNHIRVTLSSSSYKILYPVGGYIAIPRDLNDVPQLIIGSKDDDTYLTQYIKLYQLVKKSGSGSASEFQLLNVKMDSLQALLLQLHYTTTDLQIAKDVQDAKDFIYPEITAAYAEYKTQLGNLVRNLNHASKYAFENANALQQLSSTVTNFNNSFDKLDRQRLNYERKVKELWGDSAANDLKNLNTFLFDTVHAYNLIEVQNCMTDINDYFTGRNRDANLKKRIQQKVSDITTKLEPWNNEIEKKINNLTNDISI